MKKTIKNKIIILYCQYCVNVIGLPLYFRFYQLEFLNQYQIFINKKAGAVTPALT